MKNKKLLFLGAIGGMSYSVQEAKRMGIETVVLDYYADSQAKEYADKSYDVSTTDFETIYELVEKEQVDGVYTGFSDVNLRSMDKVCEKFGFPCYAGKEQIAYTQDKNLFKDLCNRNDVPTPQSYSVGALEAIVFPVIIKPADAYAAKGITICREKEKLQECIEYAKSFSQNGGVTIEDYIEGDEVMMHYVMMNGEFRITSAYERKIAEPFDASGKDIAPILIFNNDEFQKMVLPHEENLGKMYRSIGMSNAVGFLQGKIRDGKVYFFEMALRFGGNVSELFNKHFNGVDLIAEFMKYSLTGQMESNVIDKLTPAWDGFACNVSLFMRPGKVVAMEGEELLHNYSEILDVQRYGSIGDEVTEQMIGTYKAIAYRLVCATDTPTSLETLVKQLQSKIRVLNEQGEDLIDWELVLKNLAEVSV